jgi:ribonucleotide monophosphatase NagD (HAD superfamily)
MPQQLSFSEASRIRLFNGVEGHTATWHLPNFTNFTVQPLLDGGIQHALLDLDGCLTPAYHHDELTPEVVQAVRAMRIGLLTVSLATNNERDLTMLQNELRFTHIFQPYQPDTMLPYKPAKAYYEHVIGTLAVPPETIVMIGDNPEHDIEGAAEHGIQTMLVDRLDPYGFFKS